MNAFWKNILGTVIAAGILANVALLYQFNARLAVIESKLGIASPQIAQTSQNEYAKKP